MRLARVLLSASLAANRRPPGYTVGIDLGTTNSAIAVLKDGIPEVVPNSRKQMTTPSIIAYHPSDGRVIVGEDARDQSTSNVQNTIVSAKRFIGRPFRAVRSYLSIAGAKVEEGSDGEVLFRCPARGEAIATEEASAQVLRALLDDAELFTGCRAERAVITIPAYFSEEQRLATLAAARLAGLAQVDLLAEPVAACLAHQLSGAVGTILVFDLGAGTFHVSVLQLCQDGSLEVRKP